MKADQPTLADLSALAPTPLQPTAVPVGEARLQIEAGANRLNVNSSARSIAQEASAPQPGSSARAAHVDDESRHRDETLAPSAQNAKPRTELSPTPLPAASARRASEPISSLTDRGIGKLAQAQPVAARQAKVDATPNTVNVTIGRVEVRAVQAPAPAPSPKRGAPPLTSLDQYLSRRNRGAGA
jgi:hypothetical protein